MVDAHGKVKCGQAARAVNARHLHQRLHHPPKRRVPLVPLFLAPRRQLPVQGFHCLAGCRKALELFKRYVRHGQQAVHVVLVPVQRVLDAFIIGKLRFKDFRIDLMVAAGVCLCVDDCARRDLHPVHRFLIRIAENPLREHIEFERVAVVAFQPVIVILIVPEALHVALSRHVAGQTVVDDDIDRDEVKPRVLVAVGLADCPSRAVIQPLGQIAAPVPQLVLLPPDALLEPVRAFIRVVEEDDLRQPVHVLRVGVENKLQAGAKLNPQPAAAPARELERNALADEAVLRRVQQLLAPLLLFQQRGQPTADDVCVRLRRLIVLFLGDDVQLRLHAHHVARFLADQLRDDVRHLDGRRVIQPLGFDLPSLPVAVVQAVKPDNIVDIPRHLLSEQSGKFLLDPVCAVKLIRLHQRLAPFPLTLLVRLLL